MSNLTSENLAGLVIDALERTAFVLADPVDEEGREELPQADHFARINYSGPANGSVFLAASSGFLQELAASMLGVEPEEIDNDQGQDALTETTNIVGGLVTLHLGGSDRCLTLGLPSAVEAAEIPAPGHGQIRCWLDAEGERLEVIWAPDIQTTAAAA